MEPEELTSKENTNPVVDDAAVTGAIATEAAPGISAEAPAPKFSDKFRERIKGAYPEDDFSDDEAYFQKASEQLDNLEQYKNNNLEANKALMEIFNAEPAVAEVLKDMIEGASFREAIARHFSPEELMPIEGDPDREGWKKNAEARAERLAENEKINQTRAENNDFTAKEIRDFAKDNNLDPEKATSVLDQIGSVLDEAYSGRISRNLLNVIYKGFNHDENVRTAAETARIAGRNEKIMTEKETKPKGDGLPMLGNANVGETPVKKASWVDNLVNNEKKKQIL